jgi:apolipoprotein N-acyltransferase
MSLDLAAARESRAKLFTFAGVSVGAADVAAAVSGILISSCFLRFQLFPLAWFAFAPLLWALARAAGTREAVRLGLIAGMTTNVPAFYWLVYTINVFGGFGYFLSTFFYLALSLYSSMQFVVLAVALRRTGFGPLALAPPLLWVTLEFLYPHLFPWRLGHSQFLAPVLIQIGDVTGPYGLSFVMLWFAAGVARVFIEPRNLRPLIAPSLAAVAIVVYGAIRLPAVDAAMQAAPSINAVLVQGNISIKQKGDYRYFDVNLDKYAELSMTAQEGADILIWPETVSQHWIPADATRLSAKELPFAHLKTHMYFGGLAYRLTGPRQADEFNSAFFVAPDGSVRGRYDKHILMPFGEYIPLEWMLPARVRELSPATASFEAGAGTQVFAVPGKYTFAPLICYEDLVSDMSRRATAAGAQFLVNILNDAWYGNTAAPYEHQALALWRTVENRRYLLRGSNSGVTSIIDAAGRVVAEGGLFTAEVVSGEVRLMDMTTLYTRYGDLFAWLVVALAGVLLVRSGWAAGGVSASS